MADITRQGARSSRSTPTTQRLAVSPRSESSIGPAVGARSEVQNVAELRGQVRMIGVAEVTGNRRDIDARLTPQPLGRFLQSVTPDHRCWGEADVPTGQPLQGAHGDSEVSRGLLHLSH